MYVVRLYDGNVIQIPNDVPLTVTSFKRHIHCIYLCLGQINTLKFHTIAYFYQQILNYQQNQRILTSKYLYRARIKGVEITCNDLRVFYRNKVELEEKCMRLEQQVNELNTNTLTMVEHQKLECQQLTQQLNELRQQSSDQQQKGQQNHNQQLMESKREYINLENAYQQLSQQFQQYSQQVQQQLYCQDQNNNQLNEQNTEYYNKITTYKKETTKLEEQVSEMNYIIKQLSGQVQSYKEDRPIQQNKLAQVRDELENKIKELNLIVKELEDKNYEMKSQNNKLQGELKFGEEKLKLLMSTPPIVDQKVGQPQVGLNQNQIFEYENKIKIMTMTLDEKNKELKNASEQLRLQEDKIFEGTQQNKKSEYQIQKLKEQITSIESRSSTNQNLQNQQFNDQIGILNQNIKVLNGQVAQQKQAIAEFEKQIELKTKRVTEQDGVIKDITKKLSNLDQQLIQANIDLGFARRAQPNIELLRLRIRRIVENQQKKYQFNLQNAYEKLMVNPKKIAELFAEAPANLEAGKYKIWEIQLKPDVLETKITIESDLNFVECFSLKQIGEISGQQQIKPNLDGDLDRLQLFQVKNCADASLNNKILGIRQYKGIKDGIDQEQVVMASYGGSQMIAQFLYAQFCRDLKAKNCPLPIYSDLQFQKQYLLEQIRDDKKYYSVAQVLTQSPIKKYNGGHHKFISDDMSPFLNAFSYYTQHISQGQLVVTHLMVSDKQVYDPLVSTYDGYLDPIDQGNNEINTYCSIYRIAKRFKGEQYLKVLDIAIN